MMPTRACKTLLVAAATMCTMLFGLAGPAAAQNNEEIFEQFQWNFFPPGARASAMGQAFLGVADDASAAVTNPAGLVNLTRPQIYLEYKNTHLENERLAGFNSLTTLEATKFSTDINSVSFLDVAAPIGSRATVAFSRHEFLNYEEAFSLAARPSPTGVANRFLRPVDGDIDFTGTAYAGSIGVGVTSTFSLGFTIAMNQLKAASTSTRFGIMAGGPGAVSNNIIFNQSEIDAD